MTTRDEPGFDIVISYRRDDTQATSNAIYRELVRRFGADRVLLDITSIPVGEDYDAFVRRIIARARAVIVVIGPEWLTIEKNGKRRLDDEADAVRGEVTAALAAKVPLIPLLVDGAAAIEPASLPEPLRPLTRLNMMPVLERYWDTDMATLEKRLAPLLGIEAAAPQSTTRGANKLPWLIGGAAAILIAAAIGWTSFSSTPRESVSSAQQPATTATPPGVPATEPTATSAVATTIRVPLDRRALAITTILETGQPRKHSAVYGLGGDLRYGAGNWSLRGGSLFDLLRSYADIPEARFRTEVERYLPDLRDKKAVLIADQQLRDLLFRAGNEDPAMARLQEERLDRDYFAPARQQCEQLGIRSALGFALVADAMDQMTDVVFNQTVQATTEAKNGTPRSGIEEAAWLKELANQRVVSAARAKRPEAQRQTFLNSVQRRNEAYTRLMDMDKWDLGAPVPVGRFTLVDP